MTTTSLSAGDYRLDLTPAAGGSIAQFEWRSEPLFRPTCGPSILDTACFPLVPFSNRIAFGRFEADGCPVVLQPNFPGTDHPHTLHGFGWLHPWSVVTAEADHATIRHDYAAGEWPWDYGAEQEFALSPGGLTHRLTLTQRGSTAMPAGLGVHPYFPRTASTVYHGLHRCEWLTGENGLPISLQCEDQAVDWWRGQSVASRSVDTVQAGREGPLRISWPERGLGLTIKPSSNLPFTTVYTPADSGFFCVEPVSHSTDAVNQLASDRGLRWLAPGETMQVEIVYEAAQL